MTTFYRFKADSDAWEYQGVGQTEESKPSLFSSPYTSWWFSHVNHTKDYVDAVFAGDQAKAVGAVRDLWHGVLDWGCLLSDDISAALMGEHTILVKILTDSAKTGLRAGEADYLTDYLLRNLESQTAHYKNSIPNFPADEWKKLFKDHIVATGARILALSKNDKAAAEKAMSDILANRDKIAIFSDQNFPVRARTKLMITLGALVLGAGAIGLVAWWANRDRE